MGKLPQITTFFWIMKICATTLGETAGDLLPITINVGYAAIHNTHKVSEMEQNTQLKHSQELVEQFRLTTSPTIQQLAEFLALVPVSRSMIRLIQANIFQDSMPLSWVETALSSLLQPIELDESSQYQFGREFVCGVPAELLCEIPIATVQSMSETISEEIILQLPGEFQYCIFETTQAYFGQSFDYFDVFLLPSIAWRNNWLRSQMLPFTQAATTLARNWGGHYQEVADRFSQTTPMAAER
jgi:Repeat of Unknown Function (DUF347)